MKKIIYYSVLFLFIYAFEYCSDDREKNEKAKNKYILCSILVISNSPQDSDIRDAGRSYCALVLRKSVKD